MAGWTVRGMVNDITECELCGKVDLRGTVHLITEDGDEIYAGTTCAARKVGSTAAKVRDAVRVADMQREVLEAAFCDSFRKSHDGVHPREYRALSDAADHFVTRLRERFMARNGVAA
ncbi:hypothetical protein [Streptomyces scopuliridis]|uniref:Uncharacterized protein n=1 Tax=Streptomyces scopuliridis TaxID=452529 RepID=A0ACD4ZRY2_9ACTN|nr:hypothetical protein [Streptomyces scopuliridis]WSC01268.1 hypothetical protein OG835_32580 [Streptomyces scopuliridis]